MAADIETGKPFKKTLPVELTEAELSAKGKKAAKINDVIGKLELALKELKAGKTTEINEKKTARQALLHEINSGVEDRPVECVEKRDYSKGKVEVVRTDTGVVVESRTMSAEERQQATKAVAGDEDPSWGSGPEVEDVVEMKPKKGRGKKKS